MFFRTGLEAHGSISASENGFREDARAPRCGAIRSMKRNVPVRREWGTVYDRLGSNPQQDGDCSVFFHYDT